MERASLLQLARHQIGSLIATVVDFSTMIAAVQLLRLDPVVGTILGATCGAIANFLLGRAWIFRARSGPYATQGLRYAVVSGASLALNAGGEWVVNHGLGVQYVAARAFVAIAVSLGWNYPMQRHWVFRAPAE